jgi:hypothetical protein
VRRLSLVRLSAAAVSALALIVLMLLGAAGRLGANSANPAPTAVRSLTDGRVAVGSLGDSPSSADQLLTPGTAPRLDLIGDEVSPAIATYGIDKEGNLFEVHSPHTEEPRLGSPIG